MCENNNLRIEKLETHVAEIERRLAEKLKNAQEELDRKIAGAPADERRPPRSSTGGRSSTSSTSAGRRSTGARSSADTGRSSSSSAWVPRMLHIRGFAPWGCGKEEKLRKGAPDGLPDDVADRLTAMGGFALNRNVSFRTDGDARDMCDRVDRWLQCHAFKTTGYQVRCVPEAHSSPRKATATWHRICRELKVLRAQSAWEDCSRGLCFFNSDWEEIIKLIPDKEAARITVSEQKLRVIGLCRDEEEKLRCRATTMLWKRTATTPRLQ